MLDESDLNEALQKLPNSQAQTDKELAARNALLNQLSLQQLQEDIAAITKSMGQPTGQLTMAPSAAQQAWRQPDDDAEQTRSILLNPTPQSEPGLKEPGKIFRYTPDPEKNPSVFVDFDTAKSAISVDYNNPASVTAAMTLVLALNKRGLCNAISVPSDLPASVHKNIEDQCKTVNPPIQLNTYAPKPMPAPKPKESTEAASNASVTQSATPRPKPR